MKHRKIGFVIAENEECEPLLHLTAVEETEHFGRRLIRFRQGALEGVAIVCGVGKSNAAAGAAYLVSLGADLLISVGYSGGISGVRRGETALATGFAEHDFDLTMLGYEPCARPGEPKVFPADEEANRLLLAQYPHLRTGTMVTGDRFICDDAVREQLKTQFDAVSCDMESAAVAGVAYHAGVGMVAIRHVSDDAGDDAKALYREVFAGYEESAMQMALVLMDKLNEA